MSVTVFVTHSSLTDMNAEVKLSSELSVADVKKKLESHCGTAPQHQHLTLLDPSGKVIASLDDDAAMLSAIATTDGLTLHVTDLDPDSVAASLAATSVEDVAKVELSSDAAAARKAEFAKFKKASKPPVDEEHLADEAAALVVGAACSGAGKPGTVRFVGKIPEIAPGWWAGVEYSEAVGKNDGAVKGVRYFTCPENSGGFLRPDKVEMS